MTSETESKIEQSDVSVAELITHFREKCKICGHHRIMHDNLGKNNFLIIFLLSNSLITLEC